MNATAKNRNLQPLISILIDFIFFDPSVQVIERTRNEQRDRIRNQVERDNIGLNDAIQRAMQTVDQLRDADRNIDFARQLTENLDEIENSDGELGHGVLQIGILKCRLLVETSILGSKHPL